jgi:hypothetical protein
MSMFESPRFLSRVTWADAAFCAITGAVQLRFAEGLSQATGLPAPLLAGTGLFLLAYSLLAAGIASRATPPRALIGMMVAGDVAWALGCAALAFEAGLPLTPWGKLFLGAHVAAVLLMGDLQWTGLRRTARDAGSYSGSDIARHRMLKSSSN